MSPFQGDTKSKSMLGHDNTSIFSWKSGALDNKIG
jgi:hypothetical protein